MGRDKPIWRTPYRVLSILIALSWPLPVFSHGLELSAGIHTNLDGDHRQAYGNAGAVSLGYGTPITAGDTHLIAEISYLWNSGKAGQLDPTFETPEPRYWIVPLLLGIRTDLLSSSSNGSTDLYFGLGVLTAFTGYEDPYAGTRTATTLGMMFELRPQVRLSSEIAIWARERLSILSEAKYGTTQMDYTGATLQLGLSLGGP
jgi:hypothetical protein